METTIHDNNSNNSLASLNGSLLEIYKRNYPNLSELKCENNNLQFNDESFNLGYFRLNQLSTMVYEMPPKDFFKIVKVIAEVENNINYEEYFIFTVNNLLSKPTLTEEEKNTISNFVNTYLDLKFYEDFLFGNANETLSKYRQIVNNILYLSDPNNLTEGQKIITDKILSQKEDLGGRSNSMVRVLSNPDVPNMAPDDEQGYSKAGFASIILIIYSLINAAVILAIQLLK